LINFGTKLHFPNILLACVYSGSGVECNTSRNKNHRWTQMDTDKFVLHPNEKRYVTAFRV